MLDVILSEFDKLGYKTVYGVLDAVNYGVPQFRERFVLIGSRDDEDVFLPIPTHFQMHQDKKYQWQTVRSVIKDLEFDHGECATLSEERLKFLTMVPEGGNWRDLPEDIIRQIGNAVPVGLAEAIGKTVLSVANNTAVVQTKRFRGTNVHNKIRNAIELGGSLYAVK